MKLTKPQTKRHDECLSVLSLSRALSRSEVEFVYDNYLPGATNNIGRGGIFFTPGDLAADFANWCWGDGNGLDACAGIGTLSYYNLLQSPKLNIVAVEQNVEFVDVGKKLLPQVEWVRGDIFDRALISNLPKFDWGVSNPPFGRIPSAQCDWTTYRGVAHLMIAEILMRLCRRGGEMILPMADVEPTLVSGPTTTKDYLRFTTAHKGLRINPESVDCDYARALWHGAAPKVTFGRVEFDDEVNPLFDKG